MTKKRYTKGDYTNCRSDICEILKDDELYCIVNIDYVDKIIKLLEENDKLKEENKILYGDIDLLKAFIEGQGFKVKLDGDTK